MEDRKRQINNLDELTHRHEKERLSQCYQRLQDQHTQMIDHRNKLHDQLVKWLILLNHRKDTMCSLKQQLTIEVDEFEKYYQAEVAQFETDLNQLNAKCWHDFKKLEEGLMELDFVPDLLTMVHDQGEKLKMLQEWDDAENLTSSENAGSTPK